MGAGYLDFEGSLGSLLFKKVTSWGDLNDGRES